ncbi:MAG: hypothetical protein CML33_05855 [Rhodobacteraceae bacterium]|nr:hypothetical protein [Paracoccaceae bacterium]
MKVEIKNKRIINFFNENSNLDLESTLLKFVEIMEMLHENMNSTMNNTTVLDILDNLKSMNSKIDLVSSNVEKINGETQTQFTLKMGELKKDYVEELKMVLTCNVSDKIEPMFKEQNAALFEKTNNMITNIIPKNEEVVANRIESVMKDLYKNVAEDTKSLLSSAVNEETLTKYLTEFDNKITKSIESSQTILNTALSTTEQRLETRMDNIRELSTTSTQATDILNSSVHTLLNKFENSSAKGKMSENLTIDVLESLYPSAEVVSVGQTKETGDVMLTRMNKPKILVENKHWTRAVAQTEVVKFIRDIEVQKCSGVFLSQNSKITTKQNYEIDLHNGNVLVYVHDVHNDPEKIKIAVDIIDHLREKLDEYADSASDVDNIPKETLEYINTEYQSFVTAKAGITKLSKEFHRNLTKQLDDISMPSLEGFLATKFSFSSNKYSCEYCAFVGKNQQSKSAHLRGCPVRKRKELEQKEKEAKTTQSDDESEGKDDEDNQITFTVAT